MESIVHVKNLVMEERRQGWGNSSSWADIHRGTERDNGNERTVMQVVELIGISTLSQYQLSDEKC